MVPKFLRKSIIEWKVMKGHSNVSRRKWSWFGGSSIDLVVALARWHQSSALYNYSRKGDFVNDLYAKNYCVNDDTTKKLHSLWLKEKVWILRVVRNNRSKFMTDYWRSLTRFLPTSYLLKFYFSLPALLNISFSTSSKTLHLRKVWSENLTKKTIIEGNVNSILHLKKIW